MSLAVSSTVISYSVYVVILGGVSEIQTSLDVSDLLIGPKRSRRIDLLFISHAQLPVSVARCII